MIFTLCIIALILDYTMSKSAEAVKALNDLSSGEHD